MMPFGAAHRAPCSPRRDRIPEPTWPGLLRKMQYLQAPFDEPKRSAGGDRWRLQGEQQDRVLRSRLIGKCGQGADPRPAMDLPITFYKARGLAGWAKAWLKTTSDGQGARAKAKARACSCWRPDVVLADAFSPTPTRSPPLVDASLTAGWASIGPDSLRLPGALGRLQNP